MTEMVELAIRDYGLVAVFVFMFTNGCISAPASEVTLSLAGAMASITDHSFAATMACAIAGNLAGTYLLYALGRRVSLHGVETFRLSLQSRGVVGKLAAGALPSERVAAVLAARLRANGILWITVLRCVPVVRSFVSIPAGIVGMPRSTFVLGSSIGIALWALVWQAIGYRASDHWRGLGATLTAALILVTIVAVAVLHAWVRRAIRQAEAGGAS